MFIIPFFPEQRGSSLWKTLSRSSALVTTEYEWGFESKPVHSLSLLLLVYGLYRCAHFLVTSICCGVLVFTSGSLNCKLACATVKI